MKAVTRSMAVTVSMMEIGIMRVRMPQWLMVMPMAMRFAFGIVFSVVVLVMLVVNMAMLMFERRMHVEVLVPLGDVKIDANPN